MKRTIAACILLITIIFTGKAAAVEKPATFELTILHTNDVHAHLENIPYLHTAIKKEREKDGEALLFDAGDVFSGTLYFNEYLGQADAEFMNAIGYDGMTFGNHEFDRGSGVLADFIKELSFPVISSNVDVRRDPYLSPLIGKGPPEKAEGGKIYPSIIKSVRGVDVGIIGVTTEDTAFLSSPSADIQFQDAARRVKEEVASLQSKGVNHIILLSHLGILQDKVLAQTVEGIDVIIGGHSHSKLPHPIVYHGKSGPVLIVQAHEYGNDLGKIQASFSKEGVLTGWEGELIPLRAKDAKGHDRFPADPWAKERLAQLDEPIQEAKQKVIGSTTVPLIGDRHSVRTEETNLGNLITDSMVEKANSIAPVHIAFQNGGGIRTSLAKGDITIGDVLEVLPFGTALVRLDLTGEEILRALEHSVAKVEEEAGRFLQVSGITFCFDPAKDPGSRVTDVLIGGKPLDPDQSYRVATNGFLANGGDGYAVFREAKDAGRISELYISLYDVLSDYLQQHSPVSPEIEGRIRQADKE
ncbi:bifunctional metallophosphatase/5'-nucleotidase [Bacillus sp. KH172YL63]|uniref:bifunctional metallophosphatase/5'-nucleotidase n=1 Tax=Bacillus sp. KH172YL63 TaxID=2709784 RepID=UPI0013E51DAB|nr:5'-nucleotidase C-terminal domain-containing protein [Bacillus sp. KH172YL63]BCB05046.1 hypothetical protein KH172YL63_31790 [Bacillus sp. KH172YL63]